MALHYWQGRGAFSPDQWSLEFVVRREGAVVGIQAVGTRNYLVTKSGETARRLSTSRAPRSRARPGSSQASSQSPREPMPRSRVVAAPRSSASDSTAATTAHAAAPQKIAWIWAIPASLSTSTYAGHTRDE